MHGRREGEAVMAKIRSDARTMKLTLPCDLSASEVSQRAEEAVATMGKIDELDGKRKAVAAEYAAKRKELTAKLGELTAAVKTRCERRLVDVEFRAIDGRTTVQRLDNLETLRRDQVPSDVQFALPAIIRDGMYDESGADEDEWNDEGDRKSSSSR